MTNIDFKKNPVIVAILSLMIVLTFAGCKAEKKTSQEIPIPKDDQNTCSIETRAHQPMVLGQKLVNPFSVENMKMALDVVKSYPDQAASAGIRTIGAQMFINRPPILSKTKINGLMAIRVVIVGSR